VWLARVGASDRSEWAPAFAEQVMRRGTPDARAGVAAVALCADSLFWLLAERWMPELMAATAAAPVGTQWAVAERLVARQRWALAAEVLSRRPVPPECALLLDVPVAPPRVVAPVGPAPVPAPTPAPVAVFVAVPEDPGVTVAAGGPVATCISDSAADLVARMPPGLLPEWEVRTQVRAARAIRARCGTSCGNERAYLRGAAEEGWQYTGRRGQTPSAAEVCLMDVMQAFGAAAWPAVPEHADRVRVSATLDIPRCAPAP
jgi:hypothetical protein